MSAVRNGCAELAVDAAGSATTGEARPKPLPFAWIDMVGWLAAPGRRDDFNRKV